MVKSATLPTGTDRGIDTIVPDVWPRLNLPSHDSQHTNHDPSKVQDLRGTRPFLRHSSVIFSISPNPAIDPLN